MSVIKTTTLAGLVVLLAHFATLKAGQPDEGLPQIASSDAVAVASQVDQLLDASFSDQGVTPTEIARDEDFLRRVCLDLAGRIPSPQELAEFRSSTDEKKRAEVIDKLLDTKDYAKTWGSYWREVIYSRATEAKSRRSQGVFQDWMTEQLKENRPWDEITTDLLTATGDTQEVGSTGFLFAHNGDPAELAGETSRIFLGIQIQCANCHNHPYDQWKREDFHELAAFFPRIRVRRDQSGEKRTFIIESADNERGGKRQFDPDRLFKFLDRDRDGNLTAEEAKRNKQFGKRFERLIEIADKNGDGAVSREEVKDLPKPPQAKGRGDTEYFMPDLDNPSEPGTKTVPVFFVDDASVPYGTKDLDRRTSLAAAMTSPDNPWFARAFVNRIWSEMLGEGFYMPIDDMGPERQAQLPEVLDTLAAGFVANDYDVKWLFRTIANTQAYQRSVQESDSEALPAFASMSPTRLRGDQIFNAVVQVLGGNADGPRREAARLKAKKKGKGLPVPGLDGKDARQAAFSQLFNYDPSTPQVDLVGSIPQALFMMNSPVTNNAIQAEGRGVLTRLLSLTDNDDRALSAIYIRVLTREPSDAEREICHEHIADVGDRGEAFEDILWSLLNSSEFLTKR
ncbi:MAG: DUF1549 domain-containing protein [Planctomycetaceae bacterium]|nr:DUF1549 domain-containing protein [Planctomycetaceae bacterium]